MTEETNSLLTLIYNKLRFVYCVDEQISFMVQLKEMIEGEDDGHHS